MLALRTLRHRTDALKIHSLTNWPSRVAFFGTDARTGDLDALRDAVRKQYRAMLPEQVCADPKEILF